MELPTRDTPPLTVRRLLSHSAGFPEDNPWGDEQLSATDEMMDAWLAKGIPFSTPPGTRYEVPPTTRSACWVASSTRASGML